MALPWSDDDEHVAMVAFHAPSRSDFLRIFRAMDGALLYATNPLRESVKACCWGREFWFVSEPDVKLRALDPVHFEELREHEVPAVWCEARFDRRGLQCLLQTPKQCLLFALSSGIAREIPNRPAGGAYFSSFSPDGDRFVSVSLEEDALFVYDLEGAPPARIVLHGSTRTEGGLHAPLWLAWGGPRLLCVVGCRDAQGNTLAQWHDVDRLRSLGWFALFDASATSVCIYPNGTEDRALVVGTSGKNQALNVLDAARSRFVAYREVRPLPEKRHLCFCGRFLIHAQHSQSSGNFLEFSYLDCETGLWKTGERLEWKHREFGLDVSPRGKYLLLHSKEEQRFLVTKEVLGVSVGT